MPTFLRIIRKGRWHPKVDWEGWRPSDVQGDALLDLQTDDNVLSVFRVDGSVGIDRVATALAANRENLSNFDYGVFDSTLLANPSIRIVQKDGGTPDEDVNHEHYDVVNLTIVKLIQIAETVSASSPKRMPKGQMKEKLQYALSNQWLDQSRMNSGLLGQLSK